MADYRKMNRSELEAEKAALERSYAAYKAKGLRSEEHTSELQSQR